MTPGPPPSDEIHTLIITTLDAIAAAHKGQVTAGHSSILAGLERVQQAADCGETWAAPLVSRRQLALDRYCQMFEMKF